MIKHAGSRGYTRVRAVHAGSRGYTRVHAGTRRFMRVHARTCPNAQFDAFNFSAQPQIKWTEKWTKYATGTGEDAGSGAWTLGHAGSRGYTRVHARTRGFTRVRVLTLNSIHWTHKRTEEVRRRRMDKIRRRRRRGFGRVDDRTRGLARGHARTFPNAYFDTLNAQMDRGVHMMDEIRQKFCITRGGGVGGDGWAKGEVGAGDPSRSYAVSAPADQDASQLYYSFRIIGGAGGVLGGGRS